VADGRKKTIKVKKDKEANLANMKDILMGACLGFAFFYICYLIATYFPVANFVLTGRNPVCLAISMPMHLQLGKRHLTLE
jgi:hypothetical protein